MPLCEKLSLLRWLTAFPSYGFLLSVRPQHVKPVLARFHARDIACAVVGQVQAQPTVTLRHRGSEALLWDLACNPFITAGEGPPRG